MGWWLYSWLKYVGVLLGCIIPLLRIFKDQVIQNVKKYINMFINVLFLVADFGKKLNIQSSVNLTTQGTILVSGQILHMGLREAYQWGHELSAFSHSIPCPLGRFKTRAKRGPNRVFPELRGGEFCWQSSGEEVDLLVWKTSLQITWLRVSPLPCCLPGASCSFLGTLTQRWMEKTLALSFSHHS